MFPDHNLPAEPAHPRAPRERELGGLRRARRHDVCGLAIIFFAFQGIAVLLGGIGLLGDPLIRSEFLESIADLIGVLIIILILLSGIVAAGVGIIALRHATLLSLPMVALGLLPWMIVATESTVLVVLFLG